MHAKETKPSGFFEEPAAGAGAVLALVSGKSSKLFGESTLGEDTTADADKYGIVMANLPYEEGSLEPWISEKTVRLHYFKHHRGYYNLLRTYIHSHPEYQKQTVEELIRNNQGHVLLDESIFDLSVLLYNHNCYWPSMIPTGGGFQREKSASSSARLMGRMMHSEPPLSRSR